MKSAGKLLGAWIVLFTYWTCAQTHAQCTHVTDCYVEIKELFSHPNWHTYESENGLQVVFNETVEYKYFYGQGASKKNKKVPYHDSLGFRVLVMPYDSLYLDAIKNSNDSIRKAMTEKDFKAMQLKHSDLKGKPDFRYFVDETYGLRLEPFINHDSTLMIFMLDLRKKPI